MRSLLGAEWQVSGALAPALAAITLLVSVLPSILVTADRWFGNAAVVERFREPWCAIPILCRLLLPPYFLVVFACALAILMLLWIAPRWAKEELRILQSPSTVEHAPRMPTTTQTRWGRRLVALALGGVAVVLIRRALFGAPEGILLAICAVLFLVGWALLDPPVELIAVARKHAPLIIVYGLLHVTVVSILYSFSSGRTLLLSVALALLSGLALTRYWRHVHPIFWLMSAALVLYTLRLDAWYFSIIGDEYIFYRYAQEIARHQTPAFVADRLFWGTAVYGAHPYLVSLTQSIPFRIFEAQNFAWRITGIYVAALALVFIYAFARTFTAQSYALLATFLLATSHYLMSFARIGSIYTHAFLALGVALAAGAWAARSPRPLPHVVLGFAIALCFYSYPAANFVPPLPILLLLLYRPPRTREAVGLLALTLATTAILVFPLFWQPDYWLSKLPGTFVTKDLAMDPMALLGNFGSNLVYALFSFVYTPEESHFVSTSYVDPLTGAFVFVGLAVQLFLMLRNRFALFLVVGFGWLLITIGATHGNAFPTATRNTLLLPWFALFAAAGVHWVATLAWRAMAHPRVAASAVVLFGTGVLAANLALAYGVSVRRSERYHSPAELFVALAQNVSPSSGQAAREIVLINGPQGLDLPGRNETIQIYGLNVRVSEVRADTMEPEMASLRTGDRDIFFLVNPSLPRARIDAYEAFFEENGRQRCLMTTVKGSPVFTVWHVEGSGSPCVRPTW